MTTFGICTVYDGVLDYEEVAGDHFWVNERDGTLGIYDEGKHRIAAYAKPYWVSIEAQPEEAEETVGTPSDEAPVPVDPPNPNPFPFDFERIPSPPFLPSDRFPTNPFPGPNTNPFPFPGSTFTWCTCGGGEGC